MIQSPSPQPPKPTRTPGVPPPFGFGGFKGIESKAKTKKKGEKSYLVTTFKRGKQFLITPKPLVRAQALSFGVQYTKKTERATFKLIPSKRPPVKTGIIPMTEQQVWKSGYRPPIKGGRYLQGKDTFIQRKPTRLGTPMEIKSVQSYKSRGKSIW